MFKFLLNLVLASTTLYALSTPNAYAGKGKNLPLEERGEYYEKKWKAATSEIDKKRYEQKMHQADLDLEAYQENQRFLKNLTQVNVQLKGKFSLTLSPVKATETYTLTSSETRHARDLRKYLAETHERYGEKGSLYAQNGGLFRIVAELTQVDVDSMGNSFEYSLSTYGERFETLSGKSINELKIMSSAYGLDYIIHHYFDCVQEARPGDLVVYSGRDSTGGRFDHAGVWTDENTVQSWWRMWDHSFVFQHDPFFSPPHFGNIARFYRLKQKLDATESKQVMEAPLFASLRKDGTFVFENTEEASEIRSRITSSSLKELLRDFPEIEMVKAIKFFGVCYGYAMGKVFKTYSMPPLQIVPYFESSPEEMLQMFEDHFEITSEPQRGDLALYYEKDPNTGRPIPVHYGVYLVNNIVESKWGSGCVRTHPLFYVDKKYGNFVRFLRMKDTPENILKALKSNKL